MSFLSHYRQYFATCAWLCVVVVLLHATHHAACCYIQLQANNANDRCVHWAFQDLRHCHLEIDAGPASELPTSKWNTCVVAIGAEPWMCNCTNCPPPALTCLIRLFRFC